MSSDYPVLGMQETLQVLESGSVQPLGDVHHLEAALELISRGEEKAAEYKEIKKKRAQLIDEEIERIESRNEFLRSIIARTLKETKTKNVSFPGVGKVSARVKKGKWVIEDEDQLLKVLKDEGEYATIVRTEEVVQKGELNKLLDVWEKVGKLPTSVKREKDEDAVTIKFDKPALDTTHDIPVPVKAQMAAV
jgi:hypothetical protein